MPEATSKLEPGTTHGPFRLIRVLGQGGGGQVWEADDTRSGRRVALKVLTELEAESPEAWARFEREGRLAASLTHPSCVFVFGTEQLDERPAITMELMRGGTLKDLLADGPLPVSEAVARILDVIEGLEAALEAGIIHRDVKPSNCFVEEGSTRTKVGDFGVSRTLEVPSDLSLTGAFIGTPHYASPEQVRGEDLDFRSDLYSVGVTLYELITGEVPFPGGAALSVAAKILGDQPAPPSSLNPDVPRGLDRVVLRLLHKDREKRYQSYAELRKALVPFSPAVLSAGGLGKRLVAGFIDSLVLTPVGILMGFGGTAEGLITDPNVAVRLGYQALTLIPPLLYYFVMETRWAASVGKLAVGLSVVRAGGAQAADPRAVAVRSAIYVAASAGIGAILLVTTDPEEAGLWTVLLTMLYIPILFSTARRANGFAGLHDLASGTRVVSLKRGARLEVENRPLATTPVARVPAAIGPYTAEGTVWQDDGEALLIARDDELDRSILIRKYQDVARAPALERLTALSAGRLTWLQGSREPGDGWDAYGLPSGRSLGGWVVEDGRLPWSVARRVLLGVTRELADTPQGALPARLSADRIWIDETGEAKLLDFSLEPDTASAARSDAQGTTEFLRDLTILMLEGTDAPLTDGRTGPRAPLSTAARGVIAPLFADAPASLPELAEALEERMREPATVTPLRRALAIAVGAGAVLSQVVVWGIIVGMMVANPEVQHAFELDDAIEALEATSAPTPTSPDSVAAARILLASVAHARARGGLVGDFVEQFSDQEVGTMDADAVAAMLDSLAASAPVPSAAEIAMAESTFELESPFLIVLILVTAFAGLSGAVAVILALLFRGGPVLKAFATDIQTVDGRPAGRVRCALRAAVAWSPFLVATVVAWAVEGASMPERGLTVLALVMGLVGAVLAVMNPERAPQDKVVGTYLVPH